MIGILLMSTSLAAAAQTNHAEATSWAAETLASLSLEEKVAQMICEQMRGEYTADDSKAFLYRSRLARDYGIGGFVVYGGTPRDAAHLLNRLQKLAKIPLLISSDFEGGPGQQFEGASEFPANMALSAAGSETLAYQPRPQRALFRLGCRASRQNGERLYSRLSGKRHARDGEVLSRPRRRRFDGGYRVSNQLKARDSHRSRRSRCVKESDRCRRYLRDERAHCYPIAHGWLRFAGERRGEACELLASGASRLRKCVDDRGSLVPQSRRPLRRRARRRSRDTRRARRAPQTEKRHQDDRCRRSSGPRRRDSDRADRPLRREALVLEGPAEASPGTFRRCRTCGARSSARKRIATWSGGSPSVL